MGNTILTQNQRKRLFKLEIAGAVFNALAASVLHFLYEWSGKELFTALFSAVNESVWEHLKIFSIPYVVWGFVEVFCAGIPFRRLAPAKVFGLYAMITAIPVFFYTYTGILGKNIAIVDIISGFAITALAYYISYQLAAEAPFLEKYFTAAAVMFGIYCVMTAFFTFAPPQLNLFRDPMSGKYGLD